VFSRQIKYFKLHLLVPYLLSLCNPVIKNYGIFRGLNFESDEDLPAEASAQAGIGQKEAFIKGLKFFGGT